MRFLKTVFWNPEENRIRTFFRIVLLVLLSGIFASLVALIANDFSELLEKSILNFLIMPALLLSIFLAGKYFDKRSWSAFGITIMPFKQFISGLVLGCLLISCIFLTQYLLGWLSLEEMHFNSFPSYAFIIVFAGQLLRYLSGSVFEEAISRGYLLLNIAEGLEGKISKARAILISYLITSSIFGLLHLGNENASLLSSVNLILLGLLLGWRVLKTGKLHFSIGLHAGWNIFQNNIFGFANSGKASIVSLFRFENTGNTLWTGGEFGIEGGLLCTIAVLMALIVMTFSVITGQQKWHQQILK